MSFLLFWFCFCFQRDLETSEDESEGSIKDFLNDDDSEDSSTPATTPNGSESEQSIKSDEVLKKKKRGRKPAIRKTRSNAANCELLFTITNWPNAKPNFN